MSSPNTDLTDKPFPADAKLGIDPEDEIARPGAAQPQPEAQPPAPAAPFQPAPAPTPQSPPVVEAPKAPEEAPPAPPTPQQEAPVPSPAPAPEADDPDDVLETIQPSDAPKTWSFGPDGNQIQYVQKPLSYVRRMRFFARVAKALRQVLDEGGAKAVADIFGGGSFASRAQQLSQQDMSDAGDFMSVIFSAAEYAPDLILDSYCIWLNVPTDQRESLKLAWEGEIEGWPELEDDEAKEMTQIFIVQNWEAIRRFFTDHLREIGETAREQAKRSGQSNDSQQ